MHALLIPFMKINLEREFILCSVLIMVVPSPVSDRESGNRINFSIANLVKSSDSAKQVSSELTQCHAKNILVNLFHFVSCPLALRIHMHLFIAICRHSNTMIS